MTRLTSRVGTRVWYCAIASCSTGRSLWTPLPVSAEILSTGASPTKCELALRRSPSTSRRSSVSDQLPLVEHDDDRAAGGVDALGEPLILCGDAHGGVDDEQGDVGVVDRPQRPHERVVLGRVVDLRLSAHAGRVDEHHRPVSVSTSVSIASRVVPAMSWTTARSAPTRRLNSVLLPTFGRPTIATRGGAASSGIPSVVRRQPLARRVRRRAAGLVGEPLEDHVEQVAGTSTVQRAHRARARPARGS